MSVKLTLKERKIVNVLTILVAEGGFETGYIAQHVFPKEYKKAKHRISFQTRHLLKHLVTYGLVEQVPGWSPSIWRLTKRKKRYERK